MSEYNIEENNNILGAGGKGLEISNQENFNVPVPSPKIPFLKPRHQEKVDRFGEKTNLKFNSWADRLQRILKKLA